MLREVSLLPMALGLLLISQTPAAGQACYDCQSNDPENPSCWACWGDAVGACEFCFLCVTGGQGDSCLEDRGCYWANFQWHCGQTCATMGTCWSDDCADPDVAPPAELAPLDEFPYNTIIRARPIPTSNDRSRPQHRSPAAPTPHAGGAR